MSKIKTFLAGLASLLLPLMTTQAVNAQSVYVDPFCRLAEFNTQQETEEDVIADEHVEVCDLAVVTAVQVNDGAFLDAESAASAAQAMLGNTLTWRVRLMNMSNVPLDTSVNVKVQVTLPAGLSVVSSNTSVGNYADNVWTLNLTEIDGDLVIKTTANTSGTFDFFAALAGYSCDGGDFHCDYTDDDAKNDVDSSYAQVGVSQSGVLGANTNKPQVKAAVLAETGSLTWLTLLVGLSITATAFAVVRRRN